MNKAQLIKKIRFLMQDYTDKNRLIEGEEFSDVDIIMASDLALDHINDTLPFTQYQIADSPSMLLSLGTVYYLLKSKIAEKARNRMIVQTAGTSVDKEANVAMYRELSAIYKRDFLDHLSRHKGYLNMKKGMM